MNLTMIPPIDADVLIIGGGGAGLRAGIEARKYGASVVLVSRSRVGYGSNTAMSRSFLAAVQSHNKTGDSTQTHFEDTITAGCYLNDQNLAKIMVEGAEEEVHYLEQMGVNLKKKDSAFQLQHLPGHRYPRHVIGAKDRGTDYSLPLREYAFKMGVRFLESTLITRLVLKDGGVTGALGLDHKGHFLYLNAKSTILTTGGAGHIYLRTNNAAGVTGDGYALAYHAGASLQDMEFVQFYPTSVGQYGRKLWGYDILLPLGAIIRNSLGEDVLEKRGLKHLVKMTRDLLARTVMSEILDGNDIDGTLTADISSLSEESRLASINESTHELAQVAPSTHFYIGGIRINEDCETGVPRLYAAGEACGGIHGANRLAGNALTEIFVFGAIAGRKAAEKAASSEDVSSQLLKIEDEKHRLERLVSDENGENIDEHILSFQKAMWHKAGVIRNRKSLEDILETIRSLKDRKERFSAGSYRDLMKVIKFGFMLEVSEMLCRSALTREESRGAHFRTDFEVENPQWLRHIVVAKKGETMSLSSAPVDLRWLQPGT